MYRRLLNPVGRYTITNALIPSVNTPPTAANNTIVNTSPYTFTASDFNFSDADGDSLVSVKITSLESFGALTLDGVDVTLNQVIDVADINAGLLVFTGNIDSFEFTVNDGTDDSESSYTMNLTLAEI